MPQLLMTPRDYVQSDRILTEGDVEEFDKAATAAEVPPTWLLGLVFAESWDRRGERWGDWGVNYVRALIDQIELNNPGNGPAAHQALQHVIQEINGGKNPHDISFGRSQRIVLYHEEGVQGSAEERHTVENVLAVRKAVFDDPLKDLTAMARRFHGHLAAVENNPLLACCVYNGGPSAVERDDSGALFIAPWYAQKYGGHVRSYSIALATAERYRADETQPAENAPTGPQEGQGEATAAHPDRDRVRRALDVLWGWSNGVDDLGNAVALLSKEGAAEAKGAARQMREAIVAIKEEHGYQ